MRCVYFILIMFLIFCASSAKASRTELDRFCRKEFKETGKCLDDLCQTRCYGGLDYLGCDIECFGVDCAAIPVEKCPLPTCQIALGCDGHEYCLPDEYSRSAKCGELGYVGDRLECCDGLSKKCGFPVFDGTCDVGVEESIYATPMCLPCGNGICDVLENRCNCPDDCKD